MGCHTLLHAHKCYVTKTRTFMPISSIHASQNENTSIPYHDQLETVRSWRSAFEAPAQWTLPRLDPRGRPPGGRRDPNSRRVEMGRSPHGATWQSHVAGPSRPSPTPSNPSGINRHLPPCPRNLPLGNRARVHQSSGSDSERYCPYSPCQEQSVSILCSGAHLQESALLALIYSRVSCVPLLCMW